MVLVPPDAHLSCYSSVATTFYPTLVVSRILIFIFLDRRQDSKRFWTKWQQALNEFNFDLLLSFTDT
jgi:hypothetical protein